MTFRQQDEHHSLHEIVALNLRILKAVRRVSDGQIAQALGKSRAWVNFRTSGSRECQVSDLAEFAAFFGVELEQLFVDQFDLAAEAGTHDATVFALPAHDGKTLRTFRWMYANQWEIPDPAGLRGSRPSGWMYANPASVAA